MSAVGEHARIRALRSPKPPIDPWRPIDVLVEEERGPDGTLATCLTVFLAGAECPFSCVHCDLWRFTLDGATPPGALPRQLEQALASVHGGPLPETIKLYNASNFFDQRAVPPEDLPALAARLAGFRRVTVECHPRLVGVGCVRFAELLAGQLEVAMGLETVHPEALPRLGKQMTLPQFDAAVAFLRGRDIRTRAFVLLSPPYVPPSESVEWAVRSVAYALDLGVDVVALIPMRVGDGVRHRFADHELPKPPSLEMFEWAMEECLALDRGVVLADLWDAGTMNGCAACGGRRIARLREMNRTGRAGSRVACGQCGPRG